MSFYLLNVINSTINCTDPTHTFSTEDNIHFLEVHTKQGSNGVIDEYRIMGSLCRLL